MPASYRSFSQIRSVWQTESRRLETKLTELDHTKDLARKKHEATPDDGSLKYQFIRWATQRKMAKIETTKNTLTGKMKTLAADTYEALAETAVKTSTAPDQTDLYEKLISSSQHMEETRNILLNAINQCAKASSLEQVDALSAHHGTALLSFHETYQAKEHLQNAKQSLDELAHHLGSMRETFNFTATAKDLGTENNWGLILDSTAGNFVSLANAKQLDMARKQLGITVNKLEDLYTKAGNQIKKMRKDALTQMAANNAAAAQTIKEITRYL